VRPELRPGQPFPDLELPDHQGRPVRLSALADGFPLVVSFYRGYW
jgi:peroxiredoxin